MTIILGRTSEVRSDFLPAGIFETYMPTASISLLESITLNVPQTSKNNIVQVEDRQIAGVYEFQYRPIVITFTWQTEPAEAIDRFKNFINYFKARSNGRVSNPDLPVDTFTFFNNVSWSQEGLNPARMVIGMTFVNIPEVTSVAFDPVVFAGLNFTDTESQITIEETANEDPITSCSYSLNMRGDFQFGLKGYHVLKYSEVLMSQSITHIDQAFVPIFLFLTDIDIDTLIESRSSNLQGGFAPRSYTISRQIHLNVDNNVEVAQ